VTSGGVLKPGKRKSQPKEDYQPFQAFSINVVPDADDLLGTGLGGRVWWSFSASQRGVLQMEGPFFDGERRDLLERLLVTSNWGISRSQIESPSLNGLIIIG